MYINIYTYIYIYYTHHTPHTTHRTHHTHHAPRTTHTRTPGWRRLPRERRGAPGQGGFPAHRDQGVLQEGLDTDDLDVQGHPVPGHALEAPLPPRPGAGARHVALCPRRRGLRLARVRVAA